jgi:glyoxalase family protein
MFDHPTVPTQPQGPRIEGIHHVTATVGEAQPDLTFHSGVLGMRLVKKTVNFDSPGVYHFYYGDAEGSPSSLMTTFPYGGTTVREGVVGAGQVTLTRYSVPPGALDYWVHRLADAGVATTWATLPSLSGAASGGGRAPLTGGRGLEFQDPSGLRYCLVEVDNDPRTPWDSGGAPRVPLDRAIRGIHSVVLSVRRLEPSVAFATMVLGLTELLREPARVVVAAMAPGSELAIAPDAPPPAPGTILELSLAGDAMPDGVNGLGTVHHVALAVGNERVQELFRDRLLAEGVQVTGVKDRQYFQSIYFREPGGILYEIATRGPGFAIDEAPDALGRTLRLPQPEEANRERIEAGLPPVVDPSHVGRAGDPAP